MQSTSYRPIQPAVTPTRILEPSSFFLLCIAVLFECSSVPENRLDREMSRARGVPEEEERGRQPVGESCGDGRRVFRLTDRLNDGQSDERAHGPRREVESVFARVQGAADAQSARTWGGGRCSEGM